MQAEDGSRAVRARRCHAKGHTVGLNVGVLDIGGHGVRRVYAEFNKGVSPSHASQTLAMAMWPMPPILSLSVRPEK